MDGFGVNDPVVSCLVIQKVEEVLDGQRDRAARTEDHLEQIIHKLLECSLNRNIYSVSVE